MRKCKAQSTLEYVVVFAAIIGTVLVAVWYFTGHSDTSGLGKLYNKTSDRITNATARLP